MNPSPPEGPLDNPQATEAPLQLPIGTMVGRFRIEGHPTQGPLGPQFAATDVDTAMPVLLRPLPAYVLQPEVPGVKEFLTEVRAAAAFRHTGVFPVVNIFRNAGRHLLVVETPAGEDLAGKLRREGPLDQAEAATVARAVARTLHAAHKAGISHRDLKPDNIYLMADGGVKVAELGRAWAVELMNQAGTGAAVCDPAYSPPEMFSEGSRGPRVDVYQIGLLLYEMLAGAPPFAAESPDEYEELHRAAELPDLCAALPELSPRVMQIIRKAAAKSPDDRYASAKLLAADLAEIAGTAPDDDSGPAGLDSARRSRIIDPSLLPVGWDSPSRTGQRAVDKPSSAGEQRSRSGADQRQGLAGGSSHRGLQPLPKAGTRDAAAPVADGDSEASTELVAGDRPGSAPGRTSGSGAKSGRKSDGGSGVTAGRKSRPGSGTGPDAAVAAPDKGSGSGKVPRTRSGASGVEDMAGLAAGELRPLPAGSSEWWKTALLVVGLGVAVAVIVILSR